MTRLFAALLVVGSIAVACGSGGEGQPTGTATSERVERQATVAQQQQAAPDADVEEQPVDEAEPQQQTAAPEEEPQEQQVVELPTEIVGEHKGVRSERHVLGEPDAPVEIRYYGDFT
ncbi:MAG: hypothetical protein F4038_05575 [Chloroflexi bacterium]|nr:hypothetical protein [Chloroflexota bacterium]MYJ92501.1 hypothetical protein [Chloroflexota bacterium]